MYTQIQFGESSVTESWETIDDPLAAGFFNATNKIIRPLPVPSPAIQGEYKDGATVEYKLLIEDVCRKKLFFVDFFF